MYKEVQRIRSGQLPESWQAIIRRTIETNSSDSEVYNGENDLFYSVKGLGSGIWGLRELAEHSTYASDLSEPNETIREETTVYRIIRDSSLARSIKLLHNNHCQICGKALKLNNGKTYSEAHHIQPLGEPHNGPDVAENILVLCPNHHAQCDFRAIRLDIENLQMHPEHKIGKKYIKYHNDTIIDRLNKI